MRRCRRAASGAMLKAAAAGILCVSVSAHAEVPFVGMPEKHRALFKKYCYECHDALMVEGQVNLEDMSFEITTLQEARQWQKILNVLNAGEMPPEDEPQLGKAEKADFLDELANTLVLARKALSDTGGEITMRRLNRREYHNTVLSLTGSKVDINALPAGFTPRL